MRNFDLENNIYSKFTTKALEARGMVRLYEKNTGSLQRRLISRGYSTSESEVKCARLVPCDVA